MKDATSEFVVDASGDLLSDDKIQELLSVLDQATDEQAQDLLSMVKDLFNVTTYEDAADDGSVEIVTSPSLTDDNSTDFTCFIAEVALPGSYRIRNWKIEKQYRQLFLTLTFPNAVVDDTDLYKVLRVFFLCLVAAALFIVAVCSILVTGPITFALLAPILVKFAYICAGVAGAPIAIDEIKKAIADDRGKTENKLKWK